MMQLRWLPAVVAVVFLAGLVGISVLALRPLSDSTEAPPAGATQASPPSLPVVQPSNDEDDDGTGQCHGIQRAYWAVTLNPGRGEGKTEAAAELSRAAEDRGCELADTPPDGWRGGPPSWAGGPPPWAGAKSDKSAEARGQGREKSGGGEVKGGREAKGEGRRGPKWTTEGDGPPWGLAWGYWLEHDVEDVCARIDARMDAHPNAKVPEDLRDRLETELGCDLP